MVIQPSVVLCPPTLFVETTMKEPHYASCARCRIAVPFFQLAKEICSGLIRASGIIVRDPDRAQLVTYSHRNPFLYTGAPNPLKKLCQFDFGRTVFVASGSSERVAQERLRYFATVVLIGEG